MRHDDNLLREFKTKQFTVRVTAEEECDLDLSWDDDGSVTKGIESGTFIVFCAKAAVYFKGEEIATDYLGNCVYKSLNDFMDHRACGKQNRKWAKQGKEGRCGSYFKDMIHEVCRGARNYLVEHKQALNQLHVRI